MNPDWEMRRGRVKDYRDYTRTGRKIVKYDVSPADSVTYLLSFFPLYNDYEDYIYVLILMVIFIFDRKTTKDTQ